MPPLEKGLLLELPSPSTPPSCTMLLTSNSPPSRSSSSSSTSTTTTSGNATATPSTIEKMASTTASLSSRRSIRHFQRQSAAHKSTPNLFHTNKPKEIVGTTKKVHFGLANGTSSSVSSSEPQVDKKLIPHVKEFDQETRSQLWFTNHELEETIKEATRTIIAVNDGVLFTDDDPDFTTRGLEYMTPTGFNIANSSQQAVTTVLQEQERQRTLPTFTGQLDEHLLADSIQAMSRHRQRIAHLAAMKDARTVHGQGDFRCQVIQPHQPQLTTIGGEGRHHHHQQQRQDTLRASGSMEDIRRRRQISRNSSARREHRHSAPSPGSDPIVNLSPQLWRNSLS